MVEKKVGVIGCRVYMYQDKVYGFRPNKHDFKKQ